MKKTATIKREVEEEVVVVAHLCNKCGELCTTQSLERHVTSHPDLFPDKRDWYGLVDAQFSTGYFSDALPDGHVYTFSLCEDCLKALFVTFAIPPDDFNYIA